MQKSILHAIVHSILLAAITTLTITSAQADIDKAFYKKRMMGIDLQVRDGRGPTPVNIFDPVNSTPLQKGKKKNLKEFFEFNENMSAVALADGQLVYERYNEKRGFNEKFSAHGMSMTKTAVGLVIGHLLCDGRIDSLSDTMGKYSPNLTQSIYKDIAIKDVLRMASGINKDRSNEKDFNQKLRNRFEDGSNDQIAIIQSIKTTHTKPGQISSYHTLDVTAASVLATDITGLSIDKIFYDKIYSKMNPEGQMIWWADKHGHALGFAGLNMVSRDWARLGQYIVNEMQKDSCIGKFLKDGLANAIHTNARDYQKYGYFFWVSEVSGNPMIVLTGKGGQIMIPNHYNNSVAVVISASDFKYGKQHLITDIMTNATKELGAF
jgi:CubicO group peptidase (beta-lactamase class C family)